MRIFVAGATGVIGKPLMRLLVAAGHDVTGTTRSVAKSADIQKLGAVPAVVDVFNAEALKAAVAAAKPEAIIHQLTDLPDSNGLRLSRSRSKPTRVSASRAPTI